MAADPVISTAVDAALAAAGWRISPVVLRGLDAALDAAVTVLDAEAWESNGALVRATPDKIGHDVLRRLRAASEVTPAALGRARLQAPRWRAALAELWDRVDLLALPTLLGFPPALGDSRTLLRIRGLTSPVNLAGLPALALPVPTGGPLPASVQLIGPPGGEERLLAAGAVLEQAVRG
jgi:amidase